MWILAALESGLNGDAYIDFLKGERRYAITMEDNTKAELIEANKNHALEEYEILKRRSENK